jgi:hypothetical protein
MRDLHRKWRILKEIFKIQDGRIRLWTDSLNNYLLLK